MQLATLENTKTPALSKQRVLKKEIVSETVVACVVPVPYKTALSEGNVKTNRIESTKSIYHKEWSLASNYFILLKVLLQ